MKCAAVNACVGLFACIPVSLLYPRISWSVSDLCVRVLIFKIGGGGLCTYSYDVNKVIFSQCVEDCVDGVLGYGQPESLHTAADIHHDHHIFRRGGRLNVPEGNTAGWRQEVVKKKKKKAHCVLITSNPSRPRQEQAEVKLYPFICSSVLSVHGSLYLLIIIPWLSKLISINEISCTAAGSSNFPDPELSFTLIASMQAIVHLCVRSRQCSWTFIFPGNRLALHSPQTADCFHYELQLVVPTSLKDLATATACSPAWTQNLLNGLRLLGSQLSAFLSRSNKRDHITPVLAFLHWPPACFRIGLKFLLLTFKVIDLSLLF